MKFTKKQIEPLVIEIAGAEYPAIFSFAALSEIEEELQQPHSVIFVKLAKDKLLIKEIAIILCACMRAAGVTVDLNDMLSSLGMSDYNSVIDQVVKIINSGQAEVEEKDNKENTAKNA